MAHGCKYCTEDMHCQKFTDEKHTSWCYGDGYPCKDRRITNADRIRAMTDEELAVLLSNTEANFPPNYPNGVSVKLCETAWLEWLKKEVEDG